MVPGIGQRIGPYEILGRLGSGGMGLVYSAWDSRLHRDVAIKILRDEYLNSTMRTRFMGEARAASRLNHPNICTIFDIGEHEGTPYLVMELLRGDTLRGRLNQGPISVEDILSVAEEASDALSIAHAQGIVHRDIKPANIVLVDKSGGRFQTKVLDFGLAKDLDEGLNPRSGLTSTGMTVGTVSYMSPEQARGELLDQRSDIFSLGVVLYELATGKVPFTGATSALIFVHLLNEPPQPIRELNAAIPRALENIIATCLQKDKNARYQSADELFAALRKFKLSSNGETKQSWFGRLTGGAKHSDRAHHPEHSEHYERSSPVPSEETQPRPAVAGNAFIRPVKRIRTSAKRIATGQQPPFPVASSSPDVEPVGLPQNQPHEKADSPVPADQGDWPELAPGSSSVFISARTSDGQTESEMLDRLQIFGKQDSEITEAIEAKAGGGRRWRVLFGSVLVLVAFAASFIVFLVRRPLVATGASIKLMLGSIENHTGDRNLSGVVPVGLELTLQQSPRISLRNGVDPTSSQTSVDAISDPGITISQRIAKAAGANAFVVGEIHNDGPTYVISLRVVDAESGKLIGECSGTAVSRERISGAIDSLGANLRSILGESSESIHDNSVPLEREATPNFEALKAYGSGEQLQASGRLFDAMFAFERAAKLEPGFTQAHIKLAALFRRQHAELSAAHAAKSAQESSTTGSPSDRTRILAQAVYAMDMEADYAKAVSLLQQLQGRYPYDLDAFDSLTMALRLQGDFERSLNAAHATLQMAPQDSTALGELEANLLALNRIDEAARIASQSTIQSGLRPATEVLLAFMNHSSGAQTFASDQAVDDLGAQGNIAAVLDASGQFHDGLNKWREISARASSVPELASAASYALGQGALDRALASDCTGAEALIHSAASLPAGQAALFELGTASGICGILPEARKSVEALNASYAQAFSVRSFYISDLNALILWKSGLGSDALVTLDSAKGYDAISLTPYLRAVVDMSQQQPQMANVEFQTMLRRPGLLTLLSPVVYPLCQIGVARAYAASNDATNASEAYGKLLTIWPNPDPDAAIVVEARTGAR